MRQLTKFRCERLRACCRLIFVLGATGLASTAASMVWAGGGKPPTKLVNVVDVRPLEPGFVKFLGDVYNESLLLYALLVVAVMALMGVILGFALDYGLTVLGVSLGRLEHRE